VNTVENKTPAGSSSGITEQRAQEIINENTELKKQLEAAQKRASAGERLCQEFMIQARGLKMQCESYVPKVREYSVLKERYESAKSVIGKMREQLMSLQHEGKLRIAAERLLGALLTKIDESKRVSYAERLMSGNKMTNEQRESLRPILLECESKSAVNKLLKVFKSTITETRNGRGLPPITENGRRATRIPQESLLLEDNVDNRPAATPAANGKLQEAVDFTKLLVKSMKGGTGQPLNG
jgi:hypothetical protein